MGKLSYNEYKDPLKSDSDPDKKYKKSVVKLSDKGLRLSCSCCCFVEVRSVSASLSLVGYSPFTCEGSEPPQTETRYLKYRASGDGLVEACGAQAQTQRISQEWEVDPHTGIICYSSSGEENTVSRGCGELSSCSPTTKYFVCQNDTTDPCTGSTEGETTTWSESLSEQYTISDVESNVDAMLNSANPYGQNGVPSGRSGYVLSGTSNRTLIWSNSYASNRASHENNGYSVSKTKLFVQFTKGTEYILTYSDGRKVKGRAGAGQRITINPPATPNTWVDITIEQKSPIGCCTTTISPPKHSGRTTSMVFVPDQDNGSSTPYFMGPDCKMYRRFVVSVESSHTCGEASSSNYQANYEDGTGANSNSSGSGGYSKIFKSTTTYVAGQLPVVNSTANIISYSDWSTSASSRSLSSINKTVYQSSTYAESASCSFVSTEINGLKVGNGKTIIGHSGTVYYDPDCKWEPTQEELDAGETNPCVNVTTSGSATYDRIEPCSSCFAFKTPPPAIESCPNYQWEDSYKDPNDNSTVDVLGQKQTTISGASIQVNVAHKGRKGGSYRTDYSSTAYAEGVFSSSSTFKSSTTYTYSGVVRPSDPQSGGQWQTNSGANETLCALNSDQQLVKTRKDVSATYELTFNAPITEKEVTYYHWFHYYTIEHNNINGGCSTRRVRAYNEQWTSRSKGGKQIFQRAINIATPSSGTSICAYGPVFITRDKPL